jgi:radical SAM protein with 4Fe4S-binding SPASM domain
MLIVYYLGKNSQSPHKDMERMEMNGMKSDYRLTELTFEITKKCPMQCLLCSSEGGTAGNKEFSFIEIKKIINESIQLGTKHINLSGGEPLIHPDIINICSYIKEKGLTVDVYTCGNMGSLNEKIRPIDEERLEALKEICIDKLVFSIHGDNAGIHEKITTRKGSFDNLIKSIKTAKKIGLITELHFVPTKINYKSLPRVMNLVDILDIEKLSVLRFVPQGRGWINKDQLEIADNEIIELRNILQNIKNNYISSKFRTGAPFNCFLLSKESFCNAGINKAIIKPDGLVFPCVSMKDFKNKLEDNNIRKRSLSNIWIDSTFFNISRKSLQIIERESYCSKCKNFSGCKGGCLTQRLITNRLEDRDPYCVNSIPPIYKKEIQVVNIQ